MNNLNVSSLPKSYSPNFAKVFVNFTLDISKYVVPGSNTVTFYQNIYSSGVKNVTVKGPNGTIYRNDTYYSMWDQKLRSVTYKFNIATNSTTTTSTSTTTSTTTTTNTTTTTSVGGNSFRFVVFGDSRGDNMSSQVNTVILSQLSNVANSFNPAFALFTGDLCFDFASRGNCPSVWRDAMNSDLLSRTVPVLGNHDAGDTTLWQSTFDIASIVVSFGGTNYNYRPGKDGLDFSFDYGNSHFVGLVVINDVNSSTPSAEQLSWLDADLTGAESTGCGGGGCTLTFIWFHVPVYCVSLYTEHCSPPPIPPPGWTTVTNAHPTIAAIFHGHEHALAYVHINGDKVTGVSQDREYEEFISAGAGAPLYNCGPRADWCDDTNFGFMTVDVANSTARIQVYDVNGVSLHPEWVFNKNESATTTTTTTITSTSTVTSTTTTTTSQSGVTYAVDIVNGQLVDASGKKYRKVGVNYGDHPEGIQSGNYTTDAQIVADYGFNTVKLVKEGGCLRDQY